MINQQLPPTEYIFDAVHAESETMETARRDTFHTALFAAVRNGVSIARNILASPDASRLYDAAGAYLVGTAALEEESVSSDISVPLPYVIEDVLWRFADHYQAAVKGHRLPPTLNPQCRFDTYSANPSSQTYQKELAPHNKGFTLYHIVSGVRTLKGHRRESGTQVFEAELSWNDTVIVAPGARPNAKQTWSVHHVPEKSPRQAISIAQGIVQ